MATLNAKICQSYFRETDHASQTWECIKCGRERKKIKGWSNLISHIKTDLSEYQNEIHDATDEQGNFRMDQFVRKSSAKAKTIYSWMDWIVQNNEGVSFVNNRLNRKYSNLPKISKHTIEKYMTEVIY